MANSSSRPSVSSSDAPRDVDARQLAEALGITPPPGAVAAEPLRPDPTQAGHLQLDKCGALDGQPKLKAVRAYARPGEPRDFTPGSRQAADVVQPRVGRGPKPKKAVLPPRLGSLRPAEAILPSAEEIATPRGESAAAALPEDVRIPAGTFLFGEEREARDVPSFRIDRFPVTHGAYEAFVRSTGHRAPVYWPGGQMPEDLRDHPVVGIDYFDALAYARWQGKDLPYEDEWERAARGVDGRVYPWGSDPDVQAANTARSGIKMTVPVGFYAQNVSPDGVSDMVGNAWEFTHSPAPGGGVVVRGGSWYDFALYAKTYFRFAARVDARNGTIGFRCVRRDAPREDASREVEEARAESEIRSRRGPEAPADVARFSPERRDLVPDYRRLKILVAEHGSGRSASATADVEPPPAAQSRATQPPGVQPPGVPSGAPSGRAPAAPAAPPIYAGILAKSQAAAAASAPSRAAAKPPPRPAVSSGVSPGASPAVSPAVSPGMAPAEAVASAPPERPVAPAPAAPTAARTSPAIAPPTPPVASGVLPSGGVFDRVGLKKATESAVSSRHAAPSPRDEQPAKQTPLLWWGLLGAGVILCLVLLITLISNLLAGGGETDEFDEVAEEPQIVRTPGGEPAPVESLPPATPDAGTTATTPEAPSDAPADRPEEVPTPAEPPPGETPTPPVVSPPRAPVSPPQAPVIPPVVPAEAPAEPPPEPVTLPTPPNREITIDGVPDPVVGPGDSMPPRWTDGATGGWGTLATKGVWLVVFAPTPEGRALSTVRTVNGVHRRLRDTGVEVLLVLPRADFVDAKGTLLPAAEVRKKLLAYGATSDVRVLLDAPAPAPYATQGRAKFRLRNDTTAVLLSKGREEFRTASPDGAFNLMTLRDLIAQALRLGPSAVPK